MKYVFVTAIWGDKFINTWLDICLPFQIKLLKEFSGNDVFAIYTPEVPKHWSMELVEKLSNVFSESLPKLNFHNVEFTKNDNNYHAPMTFCHRQAMVDYVGPETTIVFLSPDVIYSSNCFSFLKSNIEYGYKAVLVPMFRTTRHLMINCLEEHIKSMKEIGWKTPTITPRQLLSYSLDKLHPMTESLFYESNPFCGNWPSHVYFKAPNGIIGQCWHQHPMGIVMEKSVTTDGTIDADLLVKLKIERDEIRIATDSDQFCAIEMTDISSHSPKPGFRSSPEALAWWANTYCTDLDKWYFQHRMRWHMLDAENWDESLADEILNKVNFNMENKNLVTPFDVHF